MELNFGINGDISAQAARPIAISSSTPIALVCTNDTHALGLTLYSDPYTALQAADATGNLKRSLQSIVDQGVKSPLLVHVVRSNEDQPTEKSAVIAEIQTLSQDYPITGIRPDLVIAPIWSYDTDVAAALVAEATKLWGTSILDCLSADEAEANAFVANFGSRHALIFGPALKVWDTVANDYVEVSPSAAIAGVIAKMDGERPFGWADSPSNRLVQGVAGTARVIGFAVGGDSEARRLRQKGVGSIVRDEGFRTYGAETTDIDPVWQALERVRCFYRMLRGIIQASKWARDRRADELLYVRHSVEEFMREAKGNGAVLGFEASFPEDKNTKATVTAGKFYLDIKVQNTPTVRELNIELIYTDEFSETLINFLNA